MISISRKLSALAFSNRPLLCSLALAIYVCVGCTPSAPTMSSSTKSTSAHDHDHDHAEENHADHDHPEHGPNGGHLVQIEPSDVKIEWTFDDEAGNVVVYPANLTEAGAKIESARILLEIKDQKAQDFELESGKDSTWEIKNQELVTAIPMTSAGEKGGVQAKLILKTDKGDETANLVFHDHGHSH